ncbi:MAG: hypothetical protein OXH92_21245 [Bryobacterales bacterium]|nr:hypothetical protein [Bryobacterales bacterium]MDE0296079.1 hypothetical protein [Bryobacterales bacterium]MDE0436531.1 hypothetical protein [Bryobacterales bacterium]
MDHHYREHLRIDTLRARRRAYVIIAGFAGFLATLYFTSDPDDTLTLAIALVFYFVTVLIVPDRWFGRGALDRHDDSSSASGPQPALRKQPPAAPARLQAWPAREGPLPPLPPGARRPHERTES